MKLNELLGTEFPFIQGGMANIATGEFAAACSNAGALGMIATGGWDGDRLRQEIRRAKELTDKPFGVNLMLMSPYADDIAQIILEEGVKVVTTGAGNPGKYIPAWKEKGIKVMPVVAAAVLAKRLERYGIDGIIAEGCESGGHIGELTTMALVPQVIDAVSVPVVAAGGIADGRQAAAALSELCEGGLIAERIPDGACLQLGIGAIPDATGMALKAKHDLGIHTEMFTDSMVELIECGAVNNSKKQIHRGKTVTTFAFGSQRIYDYIDDNPAVEILPVEYVNDPDVICQNDNMISINAAVEVDLFGQVCAESVGTKHMSGSGGQIDYVRGACQSRGGKSFIAFTSTAKGGTISKIKSILTPGAVVTTSKNDVDYIVTEYGGAHLRGRSVGERARQLIAIAHPDFRDELTFEAKKRGIMI